MKAVVIYLTIINLLGFIAMYRDKQKAIHRKWRTPEKTLFLIALLGGSIGSALGMQLLRHKTKGWKFKYGIPFIIIIQTVLVYVLVIINKT